MCISIVQIVSINYNSIDAFIDWEIKWVFDEIGEHIVWIVLWMISITIIKTLPFYNIFWKIIDSDRALTEIQ